MGNKLNPFSSSSSNDDPIQEYKPKETAKDQKAYDYEKNISFSLRCK